MGFFIINYLLCIYCNLKSYVNLSLVLVTLRLVNKKKRR